MSDKARATFPAPDHAAAVLDTNVALDWLVFADPGVAALAAQVGSGRMRWLACARMRDELADVLARPPFASRAASVERALTSFDALTQRVAPPVASGAERLRCTDPDDQVFLDLALQQRARWLFTRDKALLALARPALRCGLAIVAPAHWAGTPAHNP